MKAVGRALDVPLRIPHYPVWPVVAVGHVVEKACKPFGITPPIFPRRVDWYRQNRAFDITRAKRELGYAPRVDLDEGLRRTGRWYREQGYLQTRKPAIWRRSRRRNPLLDTPPQGPRGDHRAAPLTSGRRVFPV